MYNRGKRLSIIYDMDKIYSRKRIRLPRLYFSRIPNGKIRIKNKRLLKIGLILSIAIIVMIVIISSINPIIDKICLDVSKNKATSIANKKTTEVMAKYSYNDLITIYRDNQDNITMIKSNITTINDITSNIATKIQEELENDNTSRVNIKLGSLTGIRFLSGLGPNIPIKLSSSGTVITKVRSEFESTGINQTIHRLHLDVTCNVSILTPYDIIEESIKNEIILIENIIVGLVPSTYYNLEGMEKSNAIDIVE